MADLIIKPNSATGDKLILQDRAGGAVLTTASSGATIANATLTAPTITTPTIDSVKLTAGSTPGSPAEGQIYYDTSGNYCRVYDGSKWQRLTPPVNTATATSGASQATYTLQGVAYRVHRVTSTITNFVVTGTMFADVLLVSGGGGGGNNISGGGHSGGVLYIANYEIPAGTYTVTIGGGGSAAGTGSTSSFHNLSINGGHNGSDGSLKVVGKITISDDPSVYDFCESYGGYGSPIHGGNAQSGGAGASGIISTESYGLQQNSSADNRGAGGVAGVYIKDHAGSLMYDGTNHYAWAGGGGGPAYQPWAGHGGNGGGGGGGQYPGNYDSGGGIGKGGRNGLNNGTDGGYGNNSSNGGAGGANTGSGGGGGSHTNPYTSATAGPGGSGICLIRYRGT